MSRRIILDRRVVDDQVRHLDDETALPASGDVSVSLARWRAEADLLKSHVGRVGVRLASTDEVDDIAAEIIERPLIVLEFPIIETNKRGYHPEGRLFSQARKLRSRYGYTGELRATGRYVMRDMLLYLERCGCNAFEVREDKDIGDALKAFTEMSVFYQDATDDVVPVYRRRQQQSSVPH